jgi:hypothetical protein
MSQPHKHQIQRQPMLPLYAFFITMPEPNSQLKLQCQSMLNHSFVCSSTGSISTQYSLMFQNACSKGPNSGKQYEPVVSTNVCKAPAGSAVACSSGPPNTSHGLEGRRSSRCFLSAPGQKSSVFDVMYAKASGWARTSMPRCARRVLSRWLKTGS